MKPRAKRALPHWASDTFFQPKKGIGDHKYIEVPKKTNSKLSPTDYYDKRKKNAIKKTLTTEW